MKPLKLWMSIAGAVALMSPACASPEDVGSICVYTARSHGQYASEVPAFLAEHPDVRLRCPGVDPEVLYCPSRLADETGDVRCGEDEPWELVRLSTSTLTELLIAERERPKADVIWGLGVSHMWALRDEHPGLLRPYEPAHFERVRDRLLAPSSADTLWQSFIEPEVWEQMSYDVPTAVGMDAFMAVFCVNVGKMQAVIPDWGRDEHEEPTLTWSALVADERLRGKIVMPNPSYSGSGFVAIVGILQHHASRAEGGVDDGWAFLAGLDDAVDFYTTSGDAPCDLVARADNPYIVGITHDAADALPHGTESWEVRGVKRVLPAPDPAHAGGRMLGYDVAANALVEHGIATRGAAQIFLDWAVSPEAMALYAEKTPFVAYEPRVKPLPEGYPRDLTTSLRGTRLDFNAIASERVDIQGRWTAKFCPRQKDGLQPARCRVVID